MTEPHSGNEASVSTTTTQTTNTLTYTKVGLVAVAAWLLWGIICVNLASHASQQSLVKLLAEQVKAETDFPLTTLTLILTAIPAAMGLLGYAIVSLVSDRHRSRRGRRLPFILWNLPVVIVGVVAIGFGEQYLAFFQHMDTEGAIGIQPLSATLLIIGVAVGLFALACSFIKTAWLYLAIDVLPETSIGRFMAINHILGPGLFFLLRMTGLRPIDLPISWVCGGAAFIYLAGTGLMCLRIHEPAYPPPEPIHGARLRQRYAAPRFLSHRLYLLSAVARGCIAAAAASTVGTLILFRDGIGITMEQLGTVGGPSVIVMVILAYPAGWLIDRQHPVRVAIWSAIALAVTYLASLLLLRTYPAWFVLTFVGGVVMPVVHATTTPMYVRLFPRVWFARFYLWAEVVAGIVMCVLTLMSYAFIEWTTRTDGAWSSSYWNWLSPKDFSAQLGSGHNASALNWMYLPACLWSALAVICLLAVRRAWLRHGGLEGYIPPGPAPHMPGPICE